MEKPLQLFIKYLHQTRAYLGLRKYTCTYNNNNKYIIRGEPKSEQQLKPNQEDVEEEEGARAVLVKL